MDIRRWKKTHMYKKEIREINSEIFNNIFLLGQLNLATFVSIVGSISAIMIFELGIIPIGVLAGLNIGVIEICKKVSISLKQNLNELHQDMKRIKDEFDEFQGIKKEVPKERKLESYIDTKCVRSIMMDEDQLDVIDIKPSNNDSKIKLYITNDMIDSITNLMKESDMILERNNELDKKMTELFSSKVKVIKKHKINVIED